MIFYLVLSRSKPEGQVLITELRLKESAKVIESVLTTSLIEKDLMKRRSVHGGIILIRGKARIKTGNGTTVFMRGHGSVREVLRGRWTESHTRGPPAVVMIHCWSLKGGWWCGESGGHRARLLCC